MTEASVKAGRASGQEPPDTPASPPTASHAPRRRRFSVDLSSWGRKIGGSGCVHEFALFLVIAGNPPEGPLH